MTSKSEISMLKLIINSRSFIVDNSIKKYENCSSQKQNLILKLALVMSILFFYMNFNYKDPVYFAVLFYRSILSFPETFINPIFLVISIGVISSFNKKKQLVLSLIRPIILTPAALFVVFIGFAGGHLIGVVSTFPYFIVLIVYLNKRRKDKLKILNES